MLDRRHIRRQGSRSYTPLLLYVFPVLHQIRLSVDTPTQDPSLGVEASCFALPRGCRRDTPLAKHAEYYSALLRLSSSRSTFPRFSPLRSADFDFRLPRSRDLPSSIVPLTETSAPNCPSALRAVAGAEPWRGRCLEKPCNCAADLGFHEARKQARKPAERACRIHEDSERRSGASGRTPRGSILCG